jgi:hypothetical protein
MCDLKDLYLNCFALFFVWYYYKNNAEIRASNLKVADYLKERWADFKQFDKIE